MNLTEAAAHAAASFSAQLHASAYPAPRRPREPHTCRTRRCAGYPAALLPRPAPLQLTESRETEQVVNFRWKYMVSFVDALLG